MDVILVYQGGRKVTRVIRCVNYPPPLMLFSSERSRIFLGAILLTVAVVGIGTFFVTRDPHNPLFRIFRAAGSTPQNMLLPPTPAPAHVPLPKEVRGMYLAAPTILNGERFDALVALAQEHEVNTFVIDLQFINGDVAFTPHNVGLLLTKRDDRARYDLDAVTRQLHEHGMYVIGRTLVFQNTVFAATYPGDAVKRPDGALWRDRLGGAWVDPGSAHLVQYLYGLAEEAHARGVDEINLDYIRFPSDGSVKTAVYPLSKAHKEGNVYKNELLARIFKHVGASMHGMGIPVSADVFGQTLWQDDGLGIGQRILPAAEAFDVVMPMTYPSHFATNFMGFKKPVLHPYEIVRRGADLGMAAMGAASSTARAQLRFWIQAFNHKKKYTPAEVGAQIRAVREAGSSGWVLWNAMNEYEAFLPPSNLPPLPPP